MNGLTADIRHAIAVYRGTPVASAIAVVALALAMACVSAFLSMWSDLTLKPPEGFQADALLTIGQSGGYSVADSSSPLTLAMVEGINDSVGSVQSVAGIARFDQVLHENDDELSVQAEAVTQHFSDLEPRLQLGRLFEETDHRAEAEPAVILAYRLWQSAFNGDPEILGQTLRISEVGFRIAVGAPGQTNQPEQRGQDYRVVGVMSPLLTGTFSDTTDIWLPYEQVVPFLYGDPNAASRISLGLTGSITTSGTDNVPTRMRGLARVRGGASAEAVANELNSRFDIEGQALIQGLDLSGEEIRFDAIDGVVPDIATHREAQRQVSLFLAGTLLLVVVAACNVSLFLLARASRRQRELGIRMAVGASLGRLARQLASEAGLLMLVATVLGIFLSLWLSVALRELPFLQQADWRKVSPFDWRVLGLLSALMLLLTLLVSLAPILGLRKTGIRASSAMVTARAGWGQRLAGTVQIALTGIVGAVALAFAWHLAAYTRMDRGFNADDVLVVNLEPAPFVRAQAANPLSIVIERQRQRDVIAGLPGVQDASFTTYVPGGAGTIFYTVVQREAGNYVEISTIYIDEHYFDVLDIPLVYGQNIDANDRTQIVFNETYANVTFGRVNAVGEVTATDRTVRGIVPDVAYGHPAEAVTPTGYTAWPRSNYPVALIKTRASPAEMRGMLQQKIDAGELEFAVASIERLATVAGRVLRADRARTILTVSSALLVLLLAALGFYGTQRYLVTAGQREYAIRAAIGAGPGALGRLVLMRGAKLGLPGLVFGSVLALIAVGWLRDGFLVAAVSPVGVGGLIVLLIAALVLVASLGPAQQARRTAPAALLRED